MTRRAGFSLLEVLAATTLLAVLAAASIPLMQDITRSAAAGQSMRALDVLSQLTANELLDAWRSEGELQVQQYRITVTSIESRLVGESDDTIGRRYEWLRCDAAPMARGSAALASLYRVVPVPQAVPEDADLDDVVTEP